MKLFQSNIKYYSDCGFAKPTKRFTSFLIDFLLLSLITLALFGISNSILTNMESYKTYDSTVKTEIKYYNEMINKTHLVEFADDKLEVRKDTDVLAFELIQKQINLSYKKDKNNDFLMVPEKNLKYGEASFETDNFAYFFTIYLPENNEDNNIVDLEGKDYLKYYKDYFKEQVGQTNFNEYFNEGTNEEIIYIKPYVADRLYRYMYEDYKEGQEIYHLMLNYYTYIFEATEKLVVNSKNYYEPHYMVYQKAILSQGQMVNASFAITAIIGYLMVIILPQIFLRDGRTIGKMVMDIALVSKKRDEVKWYSILIRSLFGVCGSLTATLLLPVLPMFHFSYNSFGMPLFSIGSFNVSFGLIIAIIAIIGAIQAGFAVVLRNKTSLIDLASNCYVVDGRQRN